MWPVFHNNGVALPTQFDAGSGNWKCPFCDYSTPRIRQHLDKKHKDKDITNWETADKYCKEMMIVKRKETKRKADEKRADDPKRKEVLRKAGKMADGKRAEDPKRKVMMRKVDKKRAEDPKRKEVLRKADKKREPERAEDPKRKVMLRKVDKKRAEDPKRKVVLRKADEKRGNDPKRKEFMKKYAQTEFAKLSHLMAKEKYREKLGVTRRRAQYRKYKQTQIDKVRGGDAVARRIQFQKKVLRGPEYVCSCCHRSLYKKSVKSVTEKTKERIRLASERMVQKAEEEKRKAAADVSEEIMKISSERQNSNNLLKSKAGATSKLKKKMYSFQVHAFKAWNHHLLTSVNNLTYLCSTCRDTLTQGKIPSMAVANSLQLNHPDRPALTELENNLISLNINFQKMVLLPKSRMPAGKGRMISIPVGPTDVMNTVKQLPRLPTEAGVVPIKLKRKKEYKSHEKSEMIRPEQIFLALRYLRKAGHRDYQFYDEKDAYLARCKIKDQRGLRLLQDDKDDIEEDLGVPTTSDMAEVEDHAVSGSNGDGESEMEIAMREEQEDIQNDPVRRQHFDYNEFSTLVNAHPDMFLDSEGNEVLKLSKTFKIIFLESRI